MQFDSFFCNIYTYIIYILFETTYKATLPPKKHQLKNKLDLPMKLAKPYAPCFLRHIENFDNVSYVNNEGECVLRTIHNISNTKEIKFSLKLLREKFNQASLNLHDRKYKKARNNF